LPWLRPLEAWRAEFNLRPVHLKFAVEKKWHGDRFLFEYVGFSPFISIHHCSILILAHTLLLPEGQTGETWEPSKKAVLFHG
jgi:hypothetical protein